MTIDTDIGVRKRFEDNQTLTKHAVSSSGSTRADALQCQHGLRLFILPAGVLGWAGDSSTGGDDTSLMGVIRYPRELKSPSAVRLELMIYLGISFLTRVPCFPSLGTSTNEFSISPHVRSERQYDLAVCSARLTVCLIRGGPSLAHPVCTHAFSLRNTGAAGDGGVEAAVAAT